MRPYFRNVGLSVILFAGGMTVVSVIAWWTQPPNDPVKMPFVIAIFALFTLLGVYLLLLHGRYRLLVGESVIRQTGAFRDNEVDLNTVDELKWRCFPQGGSVVMSGRGNSFKIELGNFEHADRQLIIELLQHSISERQQTGRQQFDTKFTDTPKKKRQANRVYFLMGLVFGAHAVAFGAMWIVGLGIQYLVFSGINATVVAFMVMKRYRKKNQLGHVVGEQSDAPKSRSRA